jgi:hypothetical protein
MYKRYVGYGINVNQALLFCRVNRLAYSKKISKNDITSRTNITLMENIDNATASRMEQILILAYSYKNKTKNGTEFTESEYEYYKKLTIAFGIRKLNELFSSFNSKNSCVGIKEDDEHYRIIYFTK